MRSIILVLVGGILLVGCNKKVTSGNEKITYKDKAYQVFDAPQVQFYENSANDYVLATFQKSSDIPGSEPTHYAVIRIKDNEVVWEKALLIGSAKWISDYDLEIISPPGIQQGNDETSADYTYILNVKSGKKMKKAEASY